MKNKRIRINESVFASYDQKRRTTNYNVNINPSMGNQRITPNNPNDFKTSFGTKSLFSFVDHCAELRPWQQNISNRLAQTNYDFYILAQPGGGKTAPVVCYWINNILGLNTKPDPYNHPQQSTVSTDINKIIQLLTNPQTINQIIWLAPIQALNNNIELEYTERFIGGIITQFLNRFVEIDRNSNNVILNIFPTPNTTIISAIRGMGDKAGGRRLSEELINMIHDPDPNAPNPIDSMTGQPILGQNGQPLQNSIQNHQYIPSNYTETFRQQLGELVKQYVQNCLVGIRQENTDTHLIINTNYPKPFVGCIYESVSSIIDNPNYDKLKLIVCDEAQRLQGSPDQDDIRRAKQIANSMHVFLMNKNTKSAKIVMLTGTVHPNTARNMMHFLNATYNRNFKPGTLVISPDRNPSDIKVFPMSNLSDKYTQLGIINNALRRGEKRVVFIIFGKEKINDLVDTIAPSESGYLPANQPLSQSDTPSLYGKHNIKEIMNTGQDINHISDPRLRRAVSNGIGFLYRQKGEMDAQHQRDSIIVQNLFMAGKIRVLLCTDAIREGLNISIDTMYIPTIKKPSGEGMKPMEIGGLAQLVGRVGRRKGITGTIYTSPEDVSPIMTALSGDFENYKEQSFEFPDSSGIDPDNPEKYSRIRQISSKYNKLEATLNYWTGIIKGRG
jgi:hypothetical protein